MIKIVIVVGRWKVSMLCQTKCIGGNVYKAEDIKFIGNILFLSCKALYLDGKLRNTKCYINLEFSSK